MQSSDSEEYRIEDEDIEVPEDEEQPNPNLEMDTKTDLLTIESLSKIMEEIATVLLPEYAKISAEFRKGTLDI